jgi:hypothetical protein
MSCPEYLEAPALSVTPWHPIDHPHCENCHGLARPVRPGRTLTMECTYGPVQLRMSAKSLAHREDVHHLKFLVAAAQIPQSEFAPFLGVDAPTLSRYLNGGSIPSRRQKLLRSIVAIESTADAVHVVYAKRATYGTRWDATLARREHRLATPLAPDVESVSATSRQLTALLQSRRTLPEYSRPLRGRG